MSCAKIPSCHRRVYRANSFCQLTNLETNEVFNYSSANEACRSLGLSMASVSQFLNGEIY